jgi:segregation and condensation protein A
MVLGVAPHQARSYTVSTPVYEGPLDLLLQLIERAELDITKLALAQVTDQYLDYLHNLEEKDPDEVSAFLSVAARLLQIKSEMLLPRPPTREPGEEDPGELLAQQLMIYKRFKELAFLLAEREAAGLRTYLRLAPSPKAENIMLDLSGISLVDLLETIQSVFAVDTRLGLATVVSAPKVTIREKIGQIAQYLRLNRNVTFQQLLSPETFRLDIVVTFLALLELVKRSMVETHQEELFGDIEIEASENWNQNTSFELDFGE